MKFSYNRNEFVANKLGNLNGEKILDIGCRDEVFKKYLKGKFDYHGIDYDPNDEGYKENRLNYNLEKGLPDLSAKFDIINALDVLEHLENIHKIFADLTIRGITQAIEFNAFADEVKKQLKTKFKIDRTLWGITYNNRLKNEALSDAIEFDVLLQF